MAWKPSYITTSQLKDALRITDTADDLMLGYAITAASRAIDQHCGRQFGQESAPVARFYTPYLDSDNYRYVCRIDDLMTTAGLVIQTDVDNDLVFETTLVLNTDVLLAPYNAAADLLPWTRLVTTAKYGIPNINFPLRERSVMVTAQWGWSSIPDVVVQACLIQASRFFLRRNAPFGVAGSPELGNELRLLSKLDPDVAVMLSQVVRPWGAVGGGNALVWR